MTSPLRSLLFAPADSGRKLARAFESGADVVIADLEDAVAASAKAAARTTLAEFAAGAPRRRWAVRVNGAETAEHLGDLVAVVPLAPDYIMLPKCEGPGDLAMLSARLDVLEVAAGLRAGATRILPLVSETARGLENMRYGAAGPRLAALVFGAEDLSADLGVAARRPDGEMTALIAEARRRVAVAAAAAGVPAIDTPLPDHRDAGAMRRETLSAAELGYAGKLCIHPAQVALAHEALAPDPVALDWAAEVIAAFAEAPESGVAVVEGRMVDKAHLKLARKIASLRVTP